MKKHLMLKALLFSTAISLHAQSYSVDWFKVAGGGGTSSGGQYSVTGTIGQPEAGVTMSGGYYYSVVGGFWSLFAVLQSPGAPPLTITFGAGSVVISWPSSATGFVLQQNPNLATTDWTTSSYPITTNGAIESVTIISPPPGCLFFRLNQP